MISFKTTSYFRKRLHPKRGPLQQLDIPEEELYRLLSLYVDEGNRNLLIDYEYK